MANGTIAFDTLSTSGQISGTAKSVDADYLAYGSNKAWNNFSLGTSINESFNVSSITDVNTGRYTTTFTNNMDDANFSFAGGANGRSGNVTYDAGVLAIETSNDTANADIRNAVVAHGDLA